MSLSAMSSVHEKDQSSEDGQHSVHKHDVQANVRAASVPEPEYPSMRKVTVIMLVNYLAIFLVCLVRRRLPDLANIY